MDISEKCTSNTAQGRTSALEQIPIYLIFIVFGGALPTQSTFGADASHGKTFAGANQFPKKKL